MSEEDRHQRIEAVLGYHFRDAAHLDTALRHSSWSNEHPGVGGDNERLEFLGDAVLDLVVGHRLMERYPQLKEGELSVTRAQVVSEAGLAETSARLGLGDFLLLGKGEERSGGRQKPSILADVLEAVVAAVYFDGGYAAAFELVCRLLSSRIETVEFQGFYDYKTRLQEYCQGTLKMTPVYSVLAEVGPDHDKRFVISVTIGHKEWARSIGRSKKEAEQTAANDAHTRLEMLGQARVLREEREAQEAAQAQRAAAEHDKKD
jgi:ribonuclease-3